MYWWRVSKLAEDLREGRVEEKERFKYYLATFVAWNLAAQLLFRYAGPLDIKHLIVMAVNLTVIALGISFCYWANKSGDNKDFIGRMICLGWPIGVRLVILLSAFILVLVSAVVSPSPQSGPEASWSAIAEKLGEALRGFPLFLVFFIFTYYSFLYGRMSRIAQGKAAEIILQTDITQGSVGKVALAVLGVIGVPVITVLVHYRILSFGKPDILEGLLSFFLSFLAAGLWLLLTVGILVRLSRRSGKET